MILSLTSPKGISFFLSFFVHLVEPSYAYPLMSFLILAIILQMISLSYENVMVLAGQRLSSKFKRYPMGIVVSTTLVGCLFIGFASNLWLAVVQECVY
ncbi:LysE family transporter [Psychrobacter sp.]|uniref:LysE family transporter n=1 Tax=unclassified Psychrobacter TaxID=196806 RepID=UPI001CE4A803